jgi:hypothetical protein
LSPEPPRASTAWSGPPVAADGQDDVSRLLLRLDVLGRVDHLLERVAPIDNRPILPHLDELLEEDDVFLRDLTTSRFLVLHTAVTSAPKYLARSSCGQRRGYGAAGTMTTAIGRFRP